MSEALPLIDRAFARVQEGLVHYRSAGVRRSGELPLYMAHAGPGSSRGMAPTMQAMGARQFVIAPDMLGNGDSDPPAPGECDIAYYADVVVRTLDSLGIDRVNFMGSHTGALIGMELARRSPDRVEKLILDGVLIFSPEEKADLLANYAPPMVPDDHGGYLSWAWQFIRDMSLFFPHYRREPATRLPNGTAPPEQIYLGVVDVLKALRTYHIAYQAAFSYDVDAGLSALTKPVFFTCADWDPMHVYLERSSAMAPGSRHHLFSAQDGPAAKAAVLNAFLHDEATVS